MIKLESQEDITSLISEFFEKINLNTLLYNDNIAKNPYSLIHPAYIRYIAGKILNNFEYMDEAVSLLEILSKGALNSQEYSDAGEFLILKLKCERYIKDTNIKSTYKNAKKLFKNLAQLYDNDPFYIHSLIDLEKLAIKFGILTLNQSKMEKYYREAAKRYKKEADGIQDKELKIVKILSYFEALRFLFKIKNPKIDEIKERNNIANSLIYEISEEKRIIQKKRAKMSQFAKYLTEINMEYTLGKIYYFLKENIEIKHYFLSAFEKLNHLFSRIDLKFLILKSKDLIFQDDEVYTIFNVEITSKELYEELVFQLELIDLLELKREILIDLKDIGEIQEDFNKQLKSIFDDLKNIYIYIINLLLTEIKKFEPNITKETEFYSLCIYFLYQYYKLLKNKKY
ncbi:MAG: hypothetical protein ACTSQS_03035 [Promethearchaeota archaeon]